MSFPYPRFLLLAINEQRDRERQINDLQNMYYQLSLQYSNMAWYDQLAYVRRSSVLTQS